MTSNQPDRLDRIEATLERVSQQLDNQVAVNAELRQSAQQMQLSTQQLQLSTAALTDTVNVLVTSTASLVQTVTNLAGVVTQHQENFVVVTQQIGEMQSEIRGLQTENRRILDHLERGERE